MAISRAAGTYRTVINFYRRIDLLLLDFGFSPVPIAASWELLEILDGKVNTAATVIASQFPPDHFHMLIEDKTAGECHNRQIIYDAVIVKLEEESMRKLRAKQISL